MSMAGRAIEALAAVEAILLETAGIAAAVFLEGDLVLRRSGRTGWRSGELHLLLTTLNHLHHEDGHPSKQDHVK